MFRPSLPALAARARRLVPALLSVSSLLLPGFLVSLSGCNDESPPPASPRAALEAARALWHDAGLSTYTWRLTRSCFCPPLYTVPIDMQVRDGRVVALWRDPGHSPVEDPTLGMTVDSLFTVIERAIDQGYETVDVAYDERLGYPRRFQLDLAAVADEELGGRAELLCNAADEPTTPCDCAAAGDTVSYAFTARDSTGVTLAQGCLAVVFTPFVNHFETGEQLSGRRCLRVACAGGAPDAFPGAFAISGRVRPNGGLDLDLNDTWADNNIFLLGAFTNPAQEHGDFAGTWHWSTFSGSQAHGPFEARRVEWH